MPGPWDKYSQPQSQDQSGPWAKYQTQSPSDDSGPSAADRANTAIQGFGQMASAGYLPELTAAAGSLVPDPNAALDAKLKAQGVTINQPDDTYASRRDASRQQQTDMADKDPAAYYAGGVAGAIASAPAYGAALKGLGIAKNIAPVASDAGFMAKAANLGSRAVQAGREGAALGLVSNPNTQVGDDGLNLPGRIVNSVTTGGLSAAIPGAVDLVKGAAGAVGDAAKWGGTKLLSSLGGVKPDVIKEYAQFSDRINAAPSVDALKQISDDFVGKLNSDVEAKKISLDQAQDAFKGFQSDLKDTYRTAGYDARDAVTSAQQTLKDSHNARLQQLSGDVYDTVGQLKSDVQKQSEQALDTLKQSNAKVDLSPVYDQIDQTAAKLRDAGTDESHAVADRLDAYKARLTQQSGDSIAAPAAKKLIQGLDQITEYSPMAGSFDKAKNGAFKEIRGTLDQTLKDAVTEYRDAMAPVAKDASLLSRVQDFGDKQTAAGILNRIDAPNQMDRRAALQELGKRYGTDFVTAAKPENLPEQQILNKAQANVESLRPDRVADKVDQTLASSRQNSQLQSAQGAYDQAQKNLAPFKSLSPNAAGQTQAQQKLMQLSKGKNIELEDMFNQLGKLTDTNFSQAMKDRNVLAAFEKGATNGSRNTLMGSLIGFTIGGVGGAAAGGASGRVMDQWGPAVTKKILDGAIQVSKSPTVASISNLDLPEPVKRNMVIGLENYLSKEKIPVNRSMVASNPSDQNQGANRGVAGANPPKGEDKWAQTGLQNLGIKDSTIQQQLLSSPQGKKLLVQASDLKPGSAAMQKINQQIQLQLRGAQ